jgi:hypothetical protein
MPETELYVVCQGCHWKARGVVSYSERGPVRSESPLVNVFIVHKQQFPSNTGHGVGILYEEGADMDKDIESSNHREAVGFITISKKRFDEGMVRL